MSSVPDTNAASPARVWVLDLTASVGLSALRSILAAPPAAGPWLDIPMPGLPGDLHLDWHRPTTLDDLRLSEHPPLGVYVLIGPGAASRLPDLLPALAATTAVETVFLLAPNAVMESSYLRRHAPRLLPAADPVMLQLPASDAQTLWMILLAQIDGLLRRTETPYRRSQSLNSEDTTMSSNLKQSMEQAMTIEGAVAVALVDHRSGMYLAQAGGGMNLKLAAAGNSEVVRAKLRTIEALGLRNTIEDILITLQHQYHLIRLVPSNAGLFLYLALDRQRGNLALARYKLTEIERNLKV